MKKILLLITAILILFACKKKTSNDTLLIDTEHVSVEGSFVQGTINSNLCKAVIPYSNSNGGTAEIIADEVNGLKIEKQSITLNNATGEIKVNIVGTPLLLQSTFLQVQIKYEGKTYITSVEIPIASDPNPEGTVTFTIDNTPIVDLTTTTTLNFAVDPKMTAIINTTATPVQGLTITINSNSTTGQGTVTFTPGATFMGGTVQLTAQFGARPTQVVDIPVSYFATVDGTATNPFQITDAVSLAKVQYGTATQYFKVMNDFDAGTWTPMSSFNTNLDGNSKTITYNINTPTVDSVALIKKINGGTISNLTLTGTATGKSLVAGLATWSNVNLTALSGVTSTVVVTGTNNVANLVASGAGADASVLVVSTLPTAINIVAPASSGSVLLGIIPANGIAYNEVSNATGATMSYNNGDGKLTATLPGSGFTAGDVTYYASLTSAPNVHTSNFKIALSSKPMFESGTGTAGDPYMVVDADQLNQTMIAHQNDNSFITVMNDIAITSWTTVTSFNGTLDGAGHKVSGLNNPMIATLTGTVKNIKLTNVNINYVSTGSTNTPIGAVANTINTTSTVSQVAVVGTLAISGQTSDQPFGAITGVLIAGNIDNCYANVTITTANASVGGIAGWVNGTSGTNIISNCTTEGKINWTASISRIGGILGRKNEATSTTYIKNCKSSMTLQAYGTITSDGTNGVGGIFGVTVTNYGGSFSIDQCMFTGTISTIAAAAGIAGFNPTTTNCIVIGRGTTSDNIKATTFNNGTAAGIGSATKGDITKCIVVNSKITGATTGSVGAGIASAGNNGLSAITNCVVLNAAFNTGNRVISGVITTSTTGTGIKNASNNFYSDITGITPVPDVTNAGLGQDGSVAPPIMDKAWYQLLGYDNTIWDLDNLVTAGSGAYPKLRNVGCNPSVIP